MSTIPPFLTAFCPQAAALPYLGSRMDNANFTNTNANVDFSGYIPINRRANNGADPSVRRNAPQGGDLPAVDKWRTKLRRES